MTARPPSAGLLAAPLLLVMLAVVIAPCLALMAQSLLPQGASGGISFAQYATVLESRAAQQAILRTFRIGLSVTAITVVAGYPLASFIARRRPAWRGLLLAVLIFPFLLSAVVRAYGWDMILGDRGVLNNLLVASGILRSPIRLIKTETAIVIGETHLLLPYMVLSLLAVIDRIDPNLSAAAQSLGARPHEVFLRVMLPLTMPGLMTGTLLVFALAMTAFATPFMLGGPTVPVLATLLYRYAFTVFDWSRASTIAVLLLLIGSAFMVLHRRLSRRTLERQGVMT
ncbi:MAG TPA: ABC transporter permease [Xanthobacteraceae bacterium]|jgi:putative spermidine/putrescine transport system permease protein